MISEPTIGKLFIFLILQGVCTPTFQSFDYYFATKVLGITNCVISLMSMSAIMLIFFPLIYHKYF